MVGVFASRLGGTKREAVLGVQVCSISGFPFKVALFPTPWRSGFTEFSFAQLSGGRGTGLEAQISLSTAPGEDGHMTIRTDDGRSFDLPFEVKPTIDRRDHLVKFKNLSSDAVLITRSLSAAMAEQCRVRNIQFIDHAGNWLDAWTEGCLGRIRPKLEKYTMSAPIPLPAVLERVTPRVREVELGGEAAAACRGMGLKPGALTLYINFDDPSVARSLVQELKLRRDPDGKIELVNMFWNTIELASFPTVPDALIYADLVGTGDERTMEIARNLRKEICKYVTSES